MYGGWWGFTRRRNREHGMSIVDVHVQYIGPSGLAYKELGKDP